MPLYSAEIDNLKKELVDLRRFNGFFGYEGDELKLSEYLTQKYSLSARAKAHLELFKQAQWADISSFLKPTDALDFESFEETPEETPEEEFVESSNAIVKQFAEDNYFNAPELELIFDKVIFDTYHNMEVSPKLAVDPECSNILKELDKIFTFELERIKSQKSNLANVVLVQKLNKIQEKIRASKLNEASVLTSRFYNENKQDILLGYLYSEVLYAKAGLGNQKALSKAREVANNVCFLTDKSDEKLISYYRYLYVCREFAYDKDRALQLFREFVLIDPDKLTSPTVLTQRNGFFLKCLMLFLRFDINQWNIYEIETMQNFTLKSISGGVFYIALMRKELLKHLDSVRFGQFIHIEINLYNIRNAHTKLIQNIQSNFDRKGFPKNGSSNINTVGQKYLQSFFTSVNLPTFSDLLTNTSVSGIQYLESTKNDRYLASMGMSEHSLWRAWISKITSETSLQRSDIIPVEQVLKESKLLLKYESLINKAYDYELEIYSKEEYKEIKDLLSDVTSAGIIKVILGENNYSVFDYGSPWTALKDYYSNIKLAHNSSHCQLATDLLLQKGKNGIFWNLEEIQMMLESVNLMIDNKNIGLKARLDNILEMKDEQTVDDQYMTLSEHLEMYWWMYILLVSLLVFFFNMIA